VTIADYSVQAAISMELARHFPGEPIMGEEDASFLRSSEGELQRRKVVSAVRSQEPDNFALVYLYRNAVYHEPVLKRFTYIIPF
jgi:3'-phosphoadenosine 5'-phosphosulfate (PAPS) 3'-phosphatase